MVKKTQKEILQEEYGKGFKEGILKAGVRARIEEEVIELIAENRLLKTILEQKLKITLIPKLEYPEY